MIKMFQPIYADHIALVDPEFLPLKLDNNRFAAWREIRILVNMYRQGLHRHAGFTGLFSPKFNLKTGVTGQAIKSYAERNASADVVLINPFPHLAFISFNAWMQGEYAHPGLIDLAAELCDTLDLKLKPDVARRHSPKILCYSNFWLAKSGFWEAYVGEILEPIVTWLDQHQDHPLTQRLFSNTLHTDPAPFLPFIIERMLTTYLDASEWIVAAYELPLLSRCLNEFEKEIAVHFHDEVAKADRQSYFSDDLRKRMDLVTKLRQLYFWEKYNNNSHPHIIKK